MQIAEKCLVPPLEPLPGLPAAKAAPALGRGPVHACFLSKRQVEGGGSVGSLMMLPRWELYASLFRCGGHKAYEFYSLLTSGLLLL